MDSSSSYDSYSGSSSGSYTGSSSDESFEHEWESHISDDGRLFYVKIRTVSTGAVSNPVKEENKAQSEERKRAFKKKTGRLTRLLKRKKRATPEEAVGADYSPPYSPAVNKPSDFDWSKWASYTVELEVRPSVGLSGRKGINYCESLLGFTAGPPQIESWHEDSSVRQRVIVEKFVADGPLHQDRSPVQIGDWLEKINGLNVTLSDLNGILSRMQSQEIVQLCFRRKPNITTGPSNDSTVGDVQQFPESPYGALLLRHAGLTEDSPEFQDILFRYPHDIDEKLVQLRGIPATLVHVIPQVNSQRPTSSTFVLDNNVVHISYVVIEDALLVLAVPSTWGNYYRLRVFSNILEELLIFQYGSALRPFVEERSADEIKRLFDGFFGALRTGFFTPNSTRTEEMRKLGDFFETGGQMLNLPTESHLDITLTLNQMEAMDYEDWDYDASSIQRAAEMIGSAVFYKGHVVGTTLSPDLLKKIGTYLRFTQILELSQRQALEEVVVWREVYLHKPNQRHFIAVVGMNHTLLVALLENRLPMHPYDNHPDILLIEEMQYYLEELEYLELGATCESILQGPSNPLLVDEMSVSTYGEIPTYQISAGPEPTLFTFLSLDWGTGVYLAPLSLERNEKNLEIMKQFRKSCFTIHQLFQHTRRSKEDLQKADWGGPWSHKSMVALQEVSMFFTLKRSADSPTKTTVGESYCVAGRLFLTPKHREVYVCYREDVPQDLLDISFHLGFGVMP